MTQADGATYAVDADSARALRISDDGRGAASGTDGQGHGLVGMRERMAVYGGSVHAGPRTGGGYEVVATVPLDRISA